MATLQLAKITSTLLDLHVSQMETENSHIKVISKLRLHLSVYFLLSSLPQSATIGVLEVVQLEDELLVVLRDPETVHTNLL